MEYLPDYEIARRRTEEHQRKRGQLYIRVTLLGVLVLLTLVAGNEAFFCTLPLTVFVGLIAASKGVDLFYSSQRRRLPTTLVDQEMNWLFDQEWQNDTGSVEYAFAQDRIRARQTARWTFVFHLLIFVLVYIYIVIVVRGPFMPFTEDSPLWYNAIASFWIFLLVRLALNAFPTTKMLQRRERAAAQAMERELQAIQPRKLKRDEKLKPGAHFVISDDGELVEVPDSEDQNEKAKRGTQ